LIETFVGERNIYLFFLAEGQFTLHTLLMEGSFAELVTAFLSFTRTQEAFLKDPAGSYHTYCQTAHELYTLLLAPLLDSLAHPPERLVLVTAQELATTPFAALLTGPAEGDGRNYRELPYLARKYALSYAPSASLWMAATTKPQRSSTPYAGFAPDYAQVQYPNHKAQPPLRQASTEIRAASELLGGQSYLGTAATEAAFRQQSARLIHLAAHALIDEEQPLQSRILLHPADTTEDGMLHVHELYGLQLPAQLSLLGACHTAAGPYQKGEGILSLERAFLYAGCPSVVSSLWAAEDAATAAINGFFLAALQQGLPKDQALQSAQLRYLETCPPGTENPFFWSGHRLAGSTAPLVYPWWTSAIWWVASGLLLLFGGILWFRLKTRIK
ncbi:MAG: CHAT domain-containing protein, partial [Bacteroidota bacterium]